MASSSTLRTSVRFHLARRVLPSTQRTLTSSIRPRATESWLFGPQGLPSLVDARPTSQRFAKSLFATIDQDEAAKAALGRVMHLSQKAGVSPRMWLDSPDPDHPLRQVMESKEGRLTGLVRDDEAFAAAVNKLKIEFRRLGVSDQLEILFLMVDAAERKPPVAEPPSEPSS